MGSHYRARHERPASTTTADLAGLGAAQPDDDLTKAEIQDQLRELGEPTTGNKDELLERLAAAQETA